MKSIILITPIALLTLAVASQGQTNFNSGSDGSYGPMNITSDTTLDLPANGIFNCTTVNVANGATLRFNRNSLNTPVYLLATNDVTINGTIDVSGGGPNGRVPGAGGPGGFDGGWGGYGGTGFGGTGLGGDGQGPGGGKATDYPYSNYGSYESAYGNSLIVPLVGGSGGGGDSGNTGPGGGGGGGAILIASSTRIVVDGSIQSIGGSTYHAGGGSGGAIRLVAPIVTGAGHLGTLGGGNNWIRADVGRSRIDCLNGYVVRSLHADNTVSSRGSQMFIFPPGQPHLDIIQAAGQSIPLGSPNGVTVVLPKGATNAQTVVVRATNFTNDLSVTVAVIPNDRGSTTYQALLSITNNPPTVTVPVTLAVDSTNRIMVWTTY